MEQSRLWLTNFLKVLGRLSFTQKVVLGTLILATFATFTLLMQSGQNDYDVMFSGLDEADAAAVVQNLKKQGVNYKLAESGTTILVPRSKKEELRLGAFKDDLIKSDNTLGFDALGSLPFGLTSWQEQKYDQKMISDEVVKTLEKINGIKKAHVVLAQAKDSPFEAETVEPSASVMLITEPGYRLKPNQIKTIKQMVAHSVPGLKVENVALADSSGNYLAEDMVSGSGSNGEGLSEAETARLNYERQKARDIQELLLPLVGAGNVVVKVSANINYDQAESKIKRYIPTGGTPDSPLGIPVSVQNNVEDYAGKKDNNAAGGQPGVASNTPSIGLTPSESSSSTTSEKQGQYKNQQQITNYELSSEEKTIVHASGKVERLSVAVVVNKVLSEAETTELKNLVNSASGIDPTRGDSVSISGIAFSQEAGGANQATVDAIKQADSNRFTIQLVELLGLFLLGSTGLFVAYKLIKGFNFGNAPEAYDEEYSHYYQAQPGYYVSGGTHQAMPPLEGRPGYGNTLSPAAYEPSPVLESKQDPVIEHKRTSIVGMIDQDPKEAARLVKSYLRE